MVENHNNDLRYLELLARQYPTIQSASTEIINLSAILHLPKGTEHFLSDIHGEYEAFLHVLKNGSGSLRRRIEEIFSDSMLDQERRILTLLIYYPDEMLSRLSNYVRPEDTDDWYRVTLFRLTRVCRSVSSKYTRSKVRKALPPAFAYIIEELLHENEATENKHEYYSSIIDTIISTGRAPAFIGAMAELIQRLNIDHLHIIGDVYDRGPGAHIILDALMGYQSVDFQWGNHDILWMGAAAGSDTCIASVIRISLRYSNMETLEGGYGIRMLPLATFAMSAYADDPCTQFLPKPGDEEYTENEQILMARMQKAISIIQLKLEAQVIRRRPEFEMDDRLLLDKIDYTRGVIRLDGQDYSLNDTNFPTVDPSDPYVLTEEEQGVVDRLRLSFLENDKLQAHVAFLFRKGSMYLAFNGNLLYHGCIPMNGDGSFQMVTLDGQTMAGKAYLDRIDRLVRQGYFADDPAQRQFGQDMMWYLWAGPKSPLFGKRKMATFERYFIDDKTTHVEERNAYYTFRDQEETVRRIMVGFGMDPDTSHIVNGHVPVKVRRGESPVKAGGKLLVIDGGFSRAYQSETGIAGYTLIFNSYGLLLAAHEGFESAQTLIESGTDMQSKTQILQANTRRIRVRDTDLGRDIQMQIDDLSRLLDAYRAGVVKQR
ncbi:MAG: fructose-1,6-bisphosphatase [Anaerolineae bacterium]|nr:fructose-1,6-bisphosphatase [Anaerolineae bacterium]